MLTDEELIEVFDEMRLGADMGASHKETQKEEKKQ